MKKDGNKNKKINIKGLKIGVKIATIAIVALLIMSTLQSTITAFYSMTLKNKIAESGKVAMTVLEEYLSYTEEETKTVSAMMSADDDMISAVKDKDSKAIESIASTAMGQYVSFISVVDKDGNILYRSTSNANDALYKTTDIIKSALSGNTTSGYVPDFEAEMCNIVATPIKSSNNVIGAVIAGNDMTNETTIQSLAERHDCNYTVFKDDVRVQTTLKDEDGKKAVGTKFTGKEYQEILKTKESVQVINELFGKKYASIYAPILDNNDNVIGMLYSGVDIGSVLGKAQRIRTIAMTINAVLMIASVAVLVMYIKKRVSEPIAKVTAAAIEISEGHIRLGETDLDLMVNSRDEIGELAKALEGTTNMLKSYIGEMADVLEAIAGGDLCIKPKLDYKGDLINIKHSLEGISNKLNASMNGIKVSADEVSSGATQVSDGAQALSQGATEQASEIEQLSDLVKDITNQISSNAANATVASNLVSDSTEIVNNSQNTMLSLQSAMAQINEVTTKMGKVVNTIDNFAFQTNVLALNATVEAARAGAHGKGFAIVAEEVRNLASKSATAAKETGELIADTVEIVETGVSLTNATTEEFSKIVELVDEVNKKVEQIADASNAQAAAASKVVVSVDEISRVIQTNSATAEESAAASEELSGLAQSLKNIVGKFKIDGETSNIAAIDYEDTDDKSDDDYVAESQDIDSDDDKYF